MKSTHLVQPNGASGNGGAPPELIEQLARAIVRPGGNALLIDRDNRRIRWMPIAEAVALLAAFAVEVADDILAVDFDYLDGERLAALLANDLAALGVPSVLVASGGPGRAHLFARIADLALLDVFKARAKELGGDVRRTIRPPLAPHRLGLRPRLISPVDPSEALRVLCPLPRSRS
jgi:hypothetical protein